MSKACLVDTTKCIGCRACQVACQQWNDLPASVTKFLGTGGGYENPPVLSSRTYTKIEFKEILDSQDNLERSVFAKRQCMHCVEPACVSACPVAALEKTETGAIVYDGHKCMGCRYCMLACPFNIPTLQWERLAPRISKCVFCADRLEEPAMTAVKVNDESLAGDSLVRFQDSQRLPACAKVCPTGAIKFGERDDLIAEAHDRITTQSRKSDSWSYVNHLYGENEAGGTSWMYLSNVEFEKLGFPMDLGDTAYPDYTNTALKSVPIGVIGLGVILGGVYWIKNRREEVQSSSA